MGKEVSLLLRTHYPFSYPFRGIMDTRKGFFPYLKGITTLVFSLLKLSHPVSHIPYPVSRILYLPLLPFDLANLIVE